MPKWWAKLDPKKKRLVLVAGAAVILGVLYLTFRGRSAGAEETPEEQAAKERAATESGNLENTYPSAYQYGYPGGPGMEGGGGGPMTTEPAEWMEGPEGVAGGEGQEGHEGPPGEPAPAGAPAPGGGHGKPGKKVHKPRRPTKGGGKKAPGKNKPVIDHGNPGGGGGGGGGGKPKPKRRPKIGIGQARPVSRPSGGGGGGGASASSGGGSPPPSANHPLAVNTGNRCISGGVGGHTAPPGYHLFCENGWIMRAPNS